MLMADEEGPECKEEEKRGRGGEKKRKRRIKIRKKETGWGERARVGVGRGKEGRRILRKARRLWAAAVDSPPACKTVGCFPLVGLALGYDACTTVHRLCWCHDSRFIIYVDSIVRAAAMYLVHYCFKVFC
jgi:hypothetical protein